MTPDFIAIITANVLLAGLMIGLVIWLRKDIREIRCMVRKNREYLSDIQESLSRIEGLIVNLLRPGPGVR